MQAELKKIRPLQSGKILALMYAFVAAVMFPFVIIGAMLSKEGIVNAVPMVILLVLYPLFGFLAGIAGSWFYNLIAKWVGGFRFTVEQKEG